MIKYPKFIYLQAGSNNILFNCSNSLVSPILSSNAINKSIPTNSLTFSTVNSDIRYAGFGPVSYISS